MRVQLVVTGRVQGVGFRYSTVREARRLGLTGWVRNTRDGKVEIVAEGAADAIEALVGWARRGPDGASVTKVERTDPASGESFRDFQVR